MSNIDDLNEILIGRFGVIRGNKIDWEIQSKSYYYPERVLQVFVDVEKSNILVLNYYGDGSYDRNAESVDDIKGYMKEVGMTEKDISDYFEILDLYGKFFKED